MWVLEPLHRYLNQLSAAWRFAGVSSHFLSPGTVSLASLAASIRLANWSSVIFMLDIHLTTSGSFAANFLDSTMYEPSGFGHAPRSSVSTLMGSCEKAQCGVHS